MSFDLATAKPVQEGSFDLSTAKPVEMSVGTRVFQGMRDPVDASAQLLTHMLPESLVNAGNQFNNWLADRTGLVGKIPEKNLSGLVTGKTGGLDQMIADQEKQYQAARTASGNTGVDWARLGGNVVSPVNLAIASRIPAAGSLLSRVAGGAAGGAFQAATGTPVTSGDFWNEKNKQMGVGAVVGGAIPLVTGALARVVRPNTSSDVTTLLNEGVTPTPGQILGGRFQTTEDKLTSIPVLGDAISSARGKGLDELNQAVYQRALDPIGEKASWNVGREGVSAVKDKISQVYDTLLPKLTFKADPQFASDLNALQGLAANLPADQASRFTDILKTQIVGKMGPQGTMDGITLKGVDSELGRLASGYRGDPSFDNRLLGNAVQQMQSVMREALVRSNPAQAAELQGANTAWSIYTRIRDAASRQGALDGKFTPAQLSAAVRSGDNSVGKGAFATGNALLQDISDPAKNVLAPKYPDSGTAGRTLLDLGILGGATYVHPLAGAAGLTGVLPYLPGGRQVAAGILARRPALATPLAEGIRQSSPYFVPGAVPILMRNR